MNTHISDFGWGKFGVCRKNAQLKESIVRSFYDAEKGLFCTLLKGGKMESCGYVAAGVGRRYRLPSGKRG